MRKLGGAAAAVWALTGVALLFLVAVLRLGKRGLETVQAGLSPGEWVALLLLTLLFLFGEGWGALQRVWVPRLVRRVSLLRNEGRFHYRLLAPLYGMSLIGDSGKCLARAWLGTLAIITAIVVVRTFPEPWRGITDLAVASALVWGLGAVVVTGRRAFR
jgi:hypothetical protein